MIDVWKKSPIDAEGMCAGVCDSLVENFSLLFITSDSMKYVLCVIYLDYSAALIIIVILDAVISL